MDLEYIHQAFVEVAEANDWRRLHSPKNLAMALSVEASELLEHFQWMSSEESWHVLDDEGRRVAVGEEMADVMLYLVALSKQLGINLEDAVRDKIEKNRGRFL